MDDLWCSLVLKKWQNQKSKKKDLFSSLSVLDEFIVKGGEFFTLHIWGIFYGFLCFLLWFLTGGDFALEERGRVFLWIFCDDLFTLLLIKKYFWKCMPMFNVFMVLPMFSSRGRLWDHVWWNIGLYWNWHCKVISIIDIGWWYTRGSVDGFGLDVTHWCEWCCMDWSWVKSWTCARTRLRVCSCVGVAWGGTWSVTDWN